VLAHCGFVEVLYVVLVDAFGVREGDNVPG